MLYFERITKNEPGSSVRMRVGSFGVLTSRVGNGLRRAGAGALGMDGSFACPDCGCGIRLKGLSPGRQVRCDWCGAMVEAPYIPRAEEVRRLRRVRSARRRGRWTFWARAVLGVLVLAIVAVGGERAVRSRHDHVKADELAVLLESSREAEKAGRLGEALYEIEGALSVARALRPPPSNLEELNRRRDTLALREAKAQVAALASVSSGTAADPARAVGTALTLLARAAKDPALSGLVDAIRLELDRHRESWSRADMLSAAQALEEGNPSGALQLCRRAFDTARALDSAPRKDLLDEAEALARRVIERHGVVIQPPKGHFTLGSPKSYAELLNPLITSALVGQGYVLRTGGSGTAWDELWNSTAPYRVTLDVTERQDDTYLSSPSRLTHIDAKLILWRKQTPLWSQSPNAASQVPLPGLPAYLASRVAATDKRNLECERLLYEDARSSLIGRLGENLRHLPGCRRTDSHSPSAG